MRARIAKTLGWSIAVGLAAILAAPLPANAQAQTQTIHFSGMTQTQPAVNPCSGAPGTLTETVTEGVEHLTTNPDGTYHQSFRITAAITFTPDDPSQPTLTGTSTDGTGQNVNTKTSTLTATFSGRATGSDGSSVSLHGVTHATVNADGTVTVDFQIGGVSCG
ncbi:MAG TPA: hypothetical protein VGQ26_15320 [Streptosporangiaceae bacterium]|jgi:hypothetical protein|nr:hypothetical protein [Streptosporangiaceae bacterium]